MRIGQLAIRSGLSVQAIRFYERRSLIPRPRRLASGYRDYDEEAVHALLLIKNVQGLGFSLKETREFIRLLEGAAHSPAELQAFATTQVGRIDEQIRGLREMREALCAMLRHCESSRVPAPREDSV